MSIYVRPFKVIGVSTSLHVAGWLSIIYMHMHVHKILTSVLSSCSAW